MTTQPVYYEEYIKNIPWESNPMLYTNDNLAAYYAAVRLINGDKPIEESIDYNSPIWDYNRPVGDNYNQTTIAYMEDCPPELFHYVRFFQIHKLERKKKPSTICLRINDCIRILVPIIANTQHKTLGVISTDDIIEEITSRDIGQARIHSLFESIYQFYYFLEENCRLSLPVNINTIKKLGNEAKKMTKINQEKEKWPNIPEPYFDTILKGSCRIMRDESQPPRFRAVAASVVLLSQLGVRLGDLLCMTTSSMYTEDADGLTMHYINYTVEKLSKPHAPKTRFDIFASELAVESFKMLEILRELHPAHKDTDCLVLFPSQDRLGNIRDFKKNKECFPMKRSAWRGAYADYLITNFWNETHTPWDGIRETAHLYYHRGTGTYKTREKVYIPASPQYRVHLCTYLFEHGVKLSYIEEHLAHLSESMYGYYTRPKDTRQENAEMAETFIKNVIVDDMTPIGLHSEELKANLMDFIERQHLNVYTDMDKIMKVLDNEVAIRAKTGGFCYKASFLSCPEDPHTKNLLCAFNRCPNVYSFFYMADISYIKFKAHTEAYYANLQRGLRNAARKELTNSMDILARNLEPQLFQLEKELGKHGPEGICERYPQLKHIVEHLTEIKQEIRIWKTKQ